MANHEEDARQVDTEEDEEDESDLESVTAKLGESIDSGLGTDGSTVHTSDSDDDTADNSDDDFETTEDECGASCFCWKLRTWFKEQGDKSRDLLDDPFYQTNKTSLWSQVSPIPNFAQCNFDPYPSLEAETFQYSGDRDRLGRPNGRGHLYFPNGRKFSGHFHHGMRSGFGELFDREGDRIVAGQYHLDKLQGVCEVATNDGGVLEMTFASGVAHGPARRFNPDQVLQWVGRYRHGLPYGPCWRSNDGESWMYGVTNRAGRMHGDDVIYLYPDLHMALVGSWKNDGMTCGRLAKVQEVILQNGLLMPVVQQEEGLKSQYKLDVSGYSVISTQPLIPDPYESKMVECRLSGLEDGGDGLFIRRDAPAGTIVAFYNGIRFHDCHAFNDWEHNSYKIRLNEKKKQILDIPKDCRSIANYCATLAHKINHSFTPNARFSDFAHPRFGRILCVKLTKSLKAGHEIFCNYGYNLADCPQWYKDLYECNLDQTNRIRSSVFPKEVGVLLKK